MRKHIPERDWKLFKALRELAVERSCERALDEVKRLLAEPAPSHYDRYRALFKAIDRQQDDDERLEMAVRPGGNRLKEIHPPRLPAQIRVVVMRGAAERRNTNST
jgi:hypothetical protein